MAKSRPNGRPKVEEPRKSVCVWMKKGERDDLEKMAHGAGVSISNLARRMVVCCLKAGDIGQIMTVGALARSSSPRSRFPRSYVRKPKPHRLSNVASTHELRARRSGVEWERVDIRQVYHDANGICGICHHPVDFETFTLDHIVPLSRGGSHLRSNLQPAHSACNRAKGSK